MRNPTDFAQAPDSIRPDKIEAIEGAPSFEEVMHEIAVTILVCLSLALAAELLARMLG